MEILNNTVIIPFIMDVESRTLNLKVSAKVLYDLYNNGKRCICRFDPPPGIAAEKITFDIITAACKEDLYTFMAIIPSRSDVTIVQFRGEAYEEPSYEVEG